MLQKTTLVSLLLTYRAVSALVDSSAPSKLQVIDTDVAVIGGGAAGTYAAVRLQDFDTNVVLIEPRDHLGGHTSTYTVPETNTTFEYGVQSYVRNDAALDFFARFNVSVQPFAARRLNAINVDVETGAQLGDYVAPTANATTEALRRWLTIVSKYQTILEPGYWKFPQGRSIPAELLVPIEDFVIQNQLEAAIPRIIAISGIGYGGFRHLLVFNLMQSFGASLTRQVLDNSLVQPLGSNSLIYQRSLALLGSNALLSSTVVSTQRTSTGIHLRVKSSSGQEYQVNAKRVLYTAPPSLSALAPFSPDDKEKAVFSQFTTGAEHIGVARIPCIPENSSIAFIPRAAVPDKQLYLKDHPFQLRLDSTGPSGLNLFRVVFGANYTASSVEFQSTVASQVKKLSASGTLPGNCTVDFKATSDHTRPMWKLSASQMTEGFVQDLYDLQGYRGVWYSGAAWAAPYSSTVWAYTDGILERVLEDLGKGGEE